MKIYLDTNVIIDLMDSSRRFYNESCETITYSTKRAIEIVVSIQSLLDANFIINRQNKGSDNYRYMTRWMLNHVNVRPIGYFDFEKAFNSPGKDLEDAAQIALAKREYCDIFLTSDNDILQRERDEFLIFMSPGELIEKATE